MLERIKRWFRRKPKPRPAPEPTPTPVPEPTPIPTPTPTPTPTGWVEVINTNFDGLTSLPVPWGAYNWAYNSNGGGYWLPSHVVVSDGTCKLIQKYEPSGPARIARYGANGSGWYQGGIVAKVPDKHGPWSSVDHRTTVRWRVVSDGVVLSHKNMPLWWMTDPTSPIQGEEDFYESNGSINQSHAFMHYNGQTQRLNHAYPSVDMREWHTYRFQRKDHRLTAWIDDMTTPVWDEQFDSTILPNTKKIPVFQQENCSEAGGGIPPGTSGQEIIEIDFIIVEVLA